MFSLRELGGSLPALDVSGLRPHTLVASGIFEELISQVLHLSEITVFHCLKFQVLKTTVVSILPNFSLVLGVCVEGRERNPVSITPFGVEAEVETSHYRKINTL